MKTSNILGGKSKRLMALVILIVLLASTVEVVSGVYYFSEEDCPLCEKCGMKHYDAVRTTFHETFPPYSVRYDHLGCIYDTLNEKGESLGSGTLTVRFYTDEKLASEGFAKHVKGALEGMDKEYENRKTTVVAMTDETFQYKIVQYDIRKEVRYYEYCGFYLYHKKYEIFIYTQYHKDKNDAIKAFDALKQCAKELADKKEAEKEGFLSLEHYPPTFDIKVQEGGGKLVATLEDKHGNPIQGKDILFYVKRGTNPHGAFIFVGSRAWEIYDILKRSFPTINSDNNWLGTTDSRGRVEINYLFNPTGKPHIDPYGLGKALMKDGEVKVTIIAVVFDKSVEEIKRGSPTEIEYSASVPVEFTCVAKIFDIGSRSSSEKPKVRVMGVDLETGGIVRGSRQVLPKHLPYELIPGDTILLDENDVVRIQWIDGTKMEIMPKPGFLEEVSKKKGEPCFAKVTIMHGDLGLYQKMSSFMNNPWQSVVVGCGGSFIVGLISGKAGAWYTIYYALFWGGWQLGEWWKDPLIIKPYSTILIEFDEKAEKATVYTVEGTGMLYNINDGSAINVTTGHKITVSPTGEFGPLSEFDKSELNDDLIYVLDAIREEDVGPSVEGITFESHSKPSGSSVQIPLTLNGIEEKIGNMDITLSYDSSVLEATKVTKGDLTSDSLFEYNIMAGTIMISLADADGFSGNGSIAYVTFNVIGAADSTSPLQIAALAANRADDYEALTIPTNDGVFRVIFISTEESGDLTISVSDTTGAKGSTVEVSINLEGATEVGSMDIVLNYDANILSAVDVEAGELGKNALIEANTANEGTVIIALADSSGINGDGAVASVTFEVMGDAGATSYLTLEGVLVHNLDFAEIIPNTVNGTFEVI